MALLFVASACAGDGSGGATEGKAVSGGAGATASVPGQDDGCTWPTAGQNPAHTHASACAAPGAVGPDTLDRLRQVWFTETRAEVTGAPAVTDDALYLGDWSGRVYALDRATGAVRWTRDTPVDSVVYAGRITTSPTVTDVGGQQVVVVASGRTVWSLRATDGEPLWHVVLGSPSDHEDPTEIQGAPTVAGDTLLVPTDVHDNASRRSGVTALALADGALRWRWDPEADHPAGGCGGVWGSPSVDLAARLVVAGTASCFSEPSWTRYAEAIVGLDLDTGVPRWSYQPRTRINRKDWDFAGAPNLFRIGDRDVAGLGSKDGRYYVVDRDTGKLVWKAEAVKQSSTGDGLAFGGFIGATAVAPDTTGRVVVAGGTAVGDCPCEHAFDAADGDVAWQSSAPNGTYGASAAAGGLVFTAGIDQTLRAFDLRTGKVRWDHALNAISASGPSIAGDFLAIGVGFKEPGKDGPPGGGVHGFRVLAPGEAPPSSSTTTVPQGPAVTALAPSAQACVGAPCDVDFTLKDPPAGHHPTMTLQIDPDPLRITVRTTDLGPPDAWLRAGGSAQQDGATVYAVFMSPRDDKPELGSIVCTLDADGACTADSIPVPADGWTRLSVLALVDAHTPPTLQEGYDRLVTTHSFDPALAPAH